MQKRPGERIMKQPAFPRARRLEGAEERVLFCGSTGTACLHGASAYSRENAQNAQRSSRSNPFLGILCVRCTGGIGLRRRASKSPSVPLWVLPTNSKRAAIGASTNSSPKPPSLRKRRGLEGNHFIFFFHFFF